MKTIKIFMMVAVMAFGLSLATASYAVVDTDVEIVDKSAEELVVILEDTKTDLEKLRKYARNFKSLRSESMAPDYTEAKVKLIQRKYDQYKEKMQLYLDVLDVLRDTEDYGIELLADSQFDDDFVDDTHGGSGGHGGDGGTGASVGDGGGHHDDDTGSGGPTH